MDVFTATMIAEGQYDLGERFKAYGADECEFIYVNGWNFTVETIDA